MANWLDHTATGSPPTLGTRSGSGFGFGYAQVRLPSVVRQHELPAILVACPTT